MANEFRVNATGLNLREGADIATKIIVVLPAGQIVTVLDARDQKWWRVRTLVDDKQVEGFVSKNYLAPVTPSSQRSSQPARGLEEIIANSVVLTFAELKDKKHW